MVNMRYRKTNILPYYAVRPKLDLVEVDLGTTHGRLSFRLEQQQVKNY